MLAALVAGQRNPKVVAQLARRAMGNKISVLQEAFPGHFAAHHAFLLAQMPGRVDAITAGTAALDAAIEEQIAPFRCGGRQAR
jgi:transposase